MQVRLILCFLSLVCLETFASSGEVGQYSSLSPSEALRISGHYSRTARTGGGRSMKTNDFDFVALTAANEWIISATNESQPRDWASMRYDGTNIYELGTFLGNGPLGDVNPYPAYGYVYPGPFFLPNMQDSVHIFLPWTAFHLTPQMIRRAYEHNGVIEMPWPWGNSRFSLAGYGFKWILNPDGEDTIIRRLDIVRDSALDLATSEDELRRPNLDYQFRISDRDAVLRWLSMRKTIPNNFLRFSYECVGTLHTNGLTIPSETHFTEYYPTGDNRSQVVCNYVLTVERLELLSNVSIPAAVAPLKTLVFDYRYQTNNSRTKFNYAQYTLDAGDQFKSANEPALLAEAKHWLKLGDRYNSYKSKRTIVLVGMLLITGISCGLLLFRLTAAKRRQS